MYLLVSVLVIVVGCVMLFANRQRSRDVMLFVIALRRSPEAVTALANGFDSNSEQGEGSKPRAHLKILGRDRR